MIQQEIYIKLLEKQNDDLLIQCNQLCNEKVLLSKRQLVWRHFISDGGTEWTYGTNSSVVGRVTFCQGIYGIKTFDGVDKGSFETLAQAKKAVEDLFW